MEAHWYHPHPSDEETAKERLDRNFSELLQELRVAQTGVQILLGFLLTMVFTARFVTVENWQLSLYASAVCFTTLSMGFLVAPVAIHRLLFRRGLKPQLVRVAHRFMVAGLVALLLSVSTAVTLVLTIALGTGAGLAVGLLMTFTLFVLWYGTPLVVRARNGLDNVVAVEPPCPGPAEKTSAYAATVSDSDWRDDPLFPEQTEDDIDREPMDNDDRLREDVPPHHGD